MLDLQKYRAAIEEKIRWVEKSTAASILDRDLYAANVGHVNGLMDALEIMNEQLVSNDERENNDGSEDQEDAG